MTARANGSVAKARASPRNILRGNWSSSMSSASAPCARLLPVRQFSGSGSFVGVEETIADLFVESGVLFEPAVRPGLLPKRHYLGYTHDHGRYTSIRGRLTGVIAQRAPQDLADIGLRQFVAKLDLFRHLVARQACVARNARNSAAVKSGFFLTANSLPTSPECSSGTPTSAHSIRPPWLMATSSTSLGNTLKPGDRDHVLLAIDDAHAALDRP